ncbi:hydroxylysine kinase-like isoform X2 [Crassostrea virginica]
MWPMGLLSYYRDEDLLTREAQNRLIQHIAEQGICTPRPLPNLQGKLWSLERQEKSGDVRFVVRLFTFVPGRVFVGVAYTPALLHGIGKLAGKMDSACFSFSHPAFSNYKRIWSLTEVPKLTQFLICITDPQQRHLVAKVLRDFDDSVVTNYTKLKKGVIHGDLSDNNILIQPSASSPGEFQVVGFLDFGDATHSYYVFEIAILLCYVLLGACAGEDPIELAGHALAGYLSEFPLPKPDLSVLKICVTARLVQSLVLGAYTASVEPGNKDYVLQTQSKGWSLLHTLHARPATDVYTTWGRILKQYNLFFQF